MFVMVISTTPPDKAVELGKAQIKLMETPLPSYMKHVSVFAAVDETGVKGYTILEVDKGKEFEGLKELHGRMVTFYDIVGFRYKVEPILTVEEALPLVGLVPPK